MIPYMGKRIITSPILTKTSDPFPVKRTWIERLFSLPWRPWKATKMITIQVPSDEVIIMADTITMHPETLRKFQAELEKANLIKDNPYDPRRIYDRLA